MCVRERTLLTAAEKTQSGGIIRLMFFKFSTSLTRPLDSPFSEPNPADLTGAAALEQKRGGGRGKVPNNQFLIVRGGRELCCVLRTLRWGGGGSTVRSVVHRQGRAITNMQQIHKYVEQESNLVKQSRDTYSIRDCLVKIHFYNSTNPYKV